MSNRATSWAWDVEGLSPTQKLVLVKLADNANDDGYCWPSLPYIERHTGLSNSAVRTAIRSLEALGLMARVAQADERGTRPNHFQLHVPKASFAAAGVAPENRGGGTRKQGGWQEVPPEPSLEPSLEEDSLSAEPTPVSQAQSRDGEITLAVKAYNEVAERCGLPHVRKMTAARLSKLRARLKDCGGLDGWRDALAKLEASTHCTGGNDRGWRACLDFLLQESSFVKLIEGAYDDKHPKYTNGGGTSAARPMMPGEW